MVATKPNVRIRIVRHANAFPGESDRHRELSSEGVGQAMNLGRTWREEPGFNWKRIITLCSKAKRARDTAEIVLDSQARILTCEELYYDTAVGKEDLIAAHGRVGNACLADYFKAGAKGMLEKWSASARRCIFDQLIPLLPPDPSGAVRDVVVFTHAPLAQMLATSFSVGVPEAEVTLFNPPDDLLLRVVEECGVIELHAHIRLAA